MVSKLVLKGQKKTTKGRIGKPRYVKTDTTGRSIATTLPGTTQKARSVWITACNIYHLHGPAVILSKTQTKALCSDLIGNVTTSQDPTDELEPKSTQQVFVLVPLQFEEKSVNRPLEQKQQYAFKTSRNTYLTDAGDGKLTAAATSVGPKQVFIIQLENEQWTIKSSTTGQSLSLESSPEPSMVSDEAVNVVIRTQSKFSKEILPSAATDQESSLSVSVMEKKAGRKLSADEIKLLKTAYKEGNWNEALLDLRQKSKHDSRC